MRNYYFFAFSSRTESMRFYEILRKNGVASVIINTPKEASLGCGLSVKVEVSVFSYALEIFRKCAFSSFLGAFEVDYYGAGSVIRRAYW